MPPIEEHRHGSQHKHETPRDNADPLEPHSGHEQQGTVEREETHGEHGDRASRSLPRGCADLRWLQPRTIGEIVVRNRRLRFFQRTG